MDVLVQGTLTAATLALVAIGFSLVYGVGGIINFAHGSFFMIAAYTAFLVSDQGGPIGLAVLAGVAAAMVGGALLYYLVIARLRHQEVAIVIATLSVAVLVESLVRNRFGLADRRLPGLREGSTSIFGVDVLTTRVVAGAISALAIIVVLLVLQKTPVGRMVRAVAQDDEAAVLMGVRPERVVLSVVVLGAGLAGLAGALVAPYQVVTPAMWLLPLTQAFAIVILGGLGSIYGTVLAAFVVGFLDRFVAFNVSDGEVKVGLVTIIVIIATLIVRPSGILGSKAVTR